MDASNLGKWKVECQRCGFWYLNTKLAREWTGLMVCTGAGTNDCLDPRHPQDFVRGVRDDQSVPWTSPPAGAVEVVLDNMALVRLVEDNGGILIDPFYCKSYQERTGPEAMTVATSGDPVGTIYDPVSKLYMTAGADSERPTYNESGLQRWWDFDGVDDYLSIQTTSVDYSEPATFLAAAAFAGDSTFRLIGGQGGVQASIAQNATNNARLVANATGFNSAGTYSGDATVIAVSDGASSSITVNGTETTGTAGTVTIVGKMGFGAYPSGVSPWSGKIYAFALVGAGLSTSEQAVAQKMLTYRATGATDDVNPLTDF